MSKALLIVHQRMSDPGRVGELLMARGLRLDVRCPQMGHSLPCCLDDYALVAVFGGPMSANDDHLPGIRAELDWIPTALDAQLPYLGICLGGQMLARVLGAKVAPHPDGHVEMGYHPIRPTDAGRSYFDGPLTVYQFHREGFDVPCGGTLLAEGDSFANQCFRYGDRAYGVQFHPEVTLDMKQRWSAYATTRLGTPGVQPAEMHIEGHGLHDPSLDAWIRRFLDKFLAIPRPGCAPAAPAAAPQASAAA